MSPETTHPDAQAPPRCPVCGTRTETRLCDVDGYEIWRCSHCATDFVAPMPSESDLRRLYDREAWFEGGEKGGYRNYDQQTEGLLPFFDSLLERIEGESSGRSVLDIGCGYGSHLARAAARGWKCFGVEISEHARKVARERHGDDIFIVESLAKIIPHEFDLILFFDAIEHFPDPLLPLYELFSKGAVTPQTSIVITTPNARSFEAVKDPTRWAYRHPPSHVIFYSAQSFETLFRKLHFSRVAVIGIHPSENGGANDSAGYQDERFPLNDRLAGYAGLLCEAAGSDFKEFMHERYVPGTWSKLAEYEHMPRYLLAQEMAAGLRVLDFGCGTGYGSALLAEKAASVLGVDIDLAALEWARTTHHHARLNFECNGDLGSGLPGAWFDLITCFEVIEHVDQPTQAAMVQSFARLLKPEGKLLISTPNPFNTANYGENPYHLHEMDEQEFLALLRKSFPHVRMLKQWIQPSVVIEPDTPTSHAHERLARDAALTPVAYVAECSQRPLGEGERLLYRDSTVDYVLDSIQKEHHQNELQLHNYQTLERFVNRGLEVAALSKEIEHINRALSEKQSALIAAGEQMQGLYNDLNQRNLEVAARDTELALIKASRLYRLSHTLRNQPLSAKKIAKLGYLGTLLVTPSPIRKRLEAVAGRLKAAAAPKARATSYQVRVRNPIATSGRPRVVHALANFMLGGSSRLVVDLTEHLGHLYEQEVITSYIPDPPAYSGLNVQRFETAHGPSPIAKYLSDLQPAFLHVHYWGACDRPWYENVFAAAEQLRIQVIENVNTPVEPFVASSVERYIFVSDYVRKNFGPAGNHGRTVYPGTDFDHFARKRRLRSGDSVGMVYRLETDKLNAASIEPLLKVAQRCPRAKILIVGGGSLLPVFQTAVADAGLDANFEFAGYVPYDDLPSYYARMRVFVAPVWKESFGQVSPMAMSLGLPVAGYDVGALPEILGSKETLAPLGDRARLADIIVQLLGDAKRCSEIGRRNRERALRYFSVEAMAAHYGQLYEEVRSLVK